VREGLEIDPRDPRLPAIDEKAEQPVRNDPGRHRDAVGVAEVRPLDLIGSPVDCLDDEGRLVIGEEAIEIEEAEAVGEPLRERRNGAWR
jgi:hypothetical protein